MFEKVKEIIADKLNVSVDEITEETNLKDDLGADSLDMMELIMAFETEYDVELPEEDLEKINTVEDIMEEMKKLGVE